MPKEMTAMQIMISMMNESVKQYSDNAQQESIFFALIEEAKKLLPVEKKQIVEAHSDGQTSIESIPHRAFAELYFNQKFTQ